MESYIGRNLGDFGIVKELGKGGQGFVFLAHQRSLKRGVALKVIPVPVSVSSSQIKRFIREAEATAKLKHPNIVEIYQIGQEIGHYFYAMELIDGWSLDKIITGTRKHILTGQDKTKEYQSHGEPKTWGENDFHLKESDIILQVSAPDESEEDDEKYDVSQAATMREGVLHDDFPLETHQYALLPTGYYRWAAKTIQQAANALEHAHQNGIIHRDIKPSNLMVSKEHIVKITDFGLARDVREETITITGRPMGTPAYMSPEQIRARITTIDKRTDIYSLGVTLYEVISLERPLKGKTTRELYDNISVKEPKDPRRMNSNVPRDLAVIALKAVEKDPDKRYQSAQKMAEDLNRYLYYQPIVAKAPTLVDKTAKFAKRNKLQILIAFLAIALSISLLGTVYMKLQRDMLAGQIEDLLEKAHQSEKEKRYGDARRFYREVLALDAGHEEALIKSEMIVAAERHKATRKAALDVAEKEAAQKAARDAARQGTEQEEAFAAARKRTAKQSAEWEAASAAAKQAKQEATQVAAAQLEGALAARSRVTRDAPNQENALPAKRAREEQKAEREAKPADELRRAREAAARKRAEKKIADREARLAAARGAARARSVELASAARGAGGASDGETARREAALAAARGAARARAARARATQKDGYVKLGNLWFAPTELLKYQVVTARAKFMRFFAIRDMSMFDIDRRGSTIVKPTAKLFKLKFSKPKLLHFQPDSDEIVRENKWVAAKASVTVSYDIEITNYDVSSPSMVRATPRVVFRKKRTETATYTCLLIRECEAIRNFLDTKKKSGEFSLSPSNHIYRISKGPTGRFSTRGRPSGSGKERSYMQSVYFQEPKYGFVIAVIYDHEFNKIFEELSENMAG